MKKFNATMIQADINIMQTSQMGKGHDMANIDIVVRLDQPLGQDETFYFPKAEFESKKIYLANGEKRTVGDFDASSAMDTETAVAEARAAFEAFLTEPNENYLSAIVDSLEDYWELKNASEAVVIPQGTQTFTFNYKRKITANENGEFEFETVVPLPNFNLVEAAGTRASLTVNMPFDITPEKILTATWRPINGVEQQLEKVVLTGNRVLLNGYWQYDPYIKVVYRY